MLSEDSVYVQLTPRVRVWGRPGPVYLSPDSERWFGPVDPGSRASAASGREKVATSIAQNGAAPLYADGAGVCLLRRGDAPRLDRITPDEAAAAMVESLEGGFARFRESIGDAFLAVAQGGAWRLTMPPAPELCVPLVESALRELSS